MEEGQTCGKGPPAAHRQGIFSSSPSQSGFAEGWIEGKGKSP